MDVFCLCQDFSRRRRFGSGLEGPSAKVPGDGLSDLEPEGVVCVVASGERSLVSGASGRKESGVADVRLACFRFVPAVGQLIRNGHNFIALDALANVQSRALTTEDIDCRWARIQ